MRRRFALLVALSAGLAFGAALVIACSAPVQQGSPIEYRDVDAGTKKRDAGGTQGDPPEPEEDPPLPDGGKPPGAVYAHTARALYMFEPLGKTLTKIGPLACLDPGDRLLDIALDRDSVMYGTSDNGFLRIDPVDANCQYIKKDPAADYPNSLAFVPLGTVDPTKEALVGYQFAPVVGSQATVYVRIGLADGVIEKIGDLNEPTAAVKYKASGDLIALIRNGNKAYLTVKTIATDAGTGNDYLAEVDPSTGKIKTILGDTKQKNLYGFGQWAGTGYGFNDTGAILEMNMATGSAAILTTLTEDGGATGWFGAGVTTNSPTKP